MQTHRRTDTQTWASRHNSAQMQAHKWTAVQMSGAADLEEAAAQAILFLIDPAAVEIGPHHADDGTTLLVADGIKEGLHPPNGVHSCSRHGCNPKSTDIVCRPIKCTPAVDIVCTLTAETALAAAETITVRISCTWRDSRQWIHKTDSRRRFQAWMTHSISI